MSVVIVKGSIWNTKHKLLVNTVNCEGVMGAGIALEAALRYPEMYIRYKKICEDGKLNIGNLWIYKESDPYWIMSFPTKRYWKLPSKMEYLELGLKKFVESYKERGIESVAFPVLGASNGGLNEESVLKVMHQYLEDVDIPVEIYLYDPKAPDDYFIEFRDILLNNKIDELVLKTKIQKNYLEKLVVAVNTDQSICQIMQFKNIKTIGDSTIRKIFEFQKSNTSLHEQQAFNF